jgi:hypothetical protein
MGAYYQTCKIPIVIGETIAGVNNFGSIKVWDGPLGV